MQDTTVRSLNLVEFAESYNDFLITVVIPICQWVTHYLACTDISLVHSLYEVFHVPCGNFQLQVPVVNCRAPSSTPRCIPDRTVPGFQYLVPGVWNVCVALPPAGSSPALERGVQTLLMPLHRLLTYYRYSNSNNVYFRIDIPQTRSSPWTEVDINNSPTDTFWQRAPGTSFEHEWRTFCKSWCRNVKHPNLTRADTTS